LLSPFDRSDQTFNLDIMSGQGNPTADVSLLATVKSYLIAVTAVALALAVRLMLDHAWADNRVYFTFYLAAIVTMYVAGRGPGLLAIVLGLLLGTWFFVTPRHSLAPALTGGWENVITYLVSCGVVLGFLMRAQQALAREQANTRELRRQASELQASEQRFQTLAEAAFEGVLISQKGILTDCNDQVSAIAGYSRAELLGKPITQFLLPQQREQVLRNVTEEKEATYELDLICKVGVQRKIEAHGRPCRGADGQRLRVSVIRDITDQNQREDALRRQAELIDLSPDGIFAKRPDGTITFWSRGAESLYGWSASEALGAKTNALLHTEFPVPEAKILAELEHMGRWSGELKHWTKHGGTVYVQSHWKASRTENNRVAEILESNTDISDRKRSEDELRRAKDELEQVNTKLEERVVQRTRSLTETTEELNAFCYTIAHDLRAPLRIQLGFAKLLKEDYGEKLGEEGKDMAERIAGAAERQGLLIQDLLAHARVSREEMLVSNVSLRNVVKQALTELALEVAEKKGSINESCLVDAEVKANASFLHLVVVNLVTNALKFVPAGRQPSIVLRSEITAGRVRLWVEDNGIGIEPAERAKLFGMFQRLHTTKNYPGTGMGLAIVKKAMQRMNGDLGVESEPGKGSRFWVELPAG
jgi:PAS domain S-box-containing protein